MHLFSLCLSRDHLFFNFNISVSTSPVSLQIFSCSFWMGAIGGATAKRHRLWSNCKSILMEVDRRAGYLSREDMLKLPGGPLVRHYVDQNGKKRHAGIPGKLRDSQCLVIIQHSMVLKISSRNGCWNFLWFDLVSPPIQLVCYLVFEGILSEALFLGIWAADRRLGVEIYERFCGLNSPWVSICGGGGLNIPFKPKNKYGD